MIKEQELRVDRAGHALRCAVIFVWLITSPMLGGIATSEGLHPWGRSVAALAIVGSAILWLGLLQRRRMQSDELEGQVISLALTTGATNALLWGPLVFLFTTLAAALGWIDSQSRADLEHFMFGLLCCQAPMAAFFGELNAQKARRRFAKACR